MKRVTKQMLMAAVILSLMTGMNVYGQRLENKNDLQSLGTVLNNDGTINTKSGVSGSFDPAGYAMTTNEKGEPVFVPTGGGGSPFTEGNEDWDDQFGEPAGINGEVKALGSDAAGNLYVGGAFTSINGNTALKYFAVWNYNSKTWSNLGNAVFDNYVEEILYYNGSVYVGGAFHNISGNGNCLHIAKWNGSAWEALGRGVDENVTALTVDNSGSLYVGGNFIYAKNATVGDDVYSNYVAKWNGTTWSALRKGFNAPVNVLVANGSEIYAGGYFTEADNTPLESTTPVKGIAKWNGTSWTSLGYGNNNGITGGPNPRVNAIMVSGSDIYVGGQFTNAGLTAANSIARFNTGNSTWYAFGSGIMNGTEPGIVNDIVIANGILVAGAFNNAGGISVSNSATWNTNWSAGLSFNGTVNEMHHGGALYYGGNFNTINTISLYSKSLYGNVAVNQTPWQSGLGMNGTVYTIVVSGSDVYVGGSFTRAGNVITSNIAKWNGTYWSNLHTGLNGPVFSIAVSNGWVYAGGAFLDASGNVYADRIAKWSGSSWYPLSGTVLNNTVRAIAISGSDVYVGGEFTDVGGNVNADRIAKWNGSTWSALGTGLNGYVNAIAVSGVSDVFVGGTFTDAGGNVNADRIAYWNGSSWAALGTALNNEVKAIAVSGINVYVGGYFTDAGGNANADYLTKWNGSSWSALGSGLNNVVHSIALSGIDVYVGGYFSDAGGNINADGIAKWNGSTWSNLGSGTNNVFALATTSTHIYAGGGFTTAGGKSSSRFGRYAINAAPVVASPIPDYSHGQGFEPFVAANLATVFSDANGDPLTYTVSVNSNIISATLQGTQLIITHIAGWGPTTVTVTANDGEYSVTDQFTVTVGFHHERKVSGMSENPKHFELSQNYPNPFNPTTTIKYALKEDVKVSLKIYNSLGQEVRTLVNEHQNAGFKEIMWDGKNNQGSAVPSGIYMYRLVAGSKFVKANKMTLMK